MDIITDAEMALSLASAIPAIITLVQTELPDVEATVLADYEAIAAPAKELIADVEVTIKGGQTTAVTANVEKTVGDLGALVTAVEAIVPKVESDATGEYAKLYPVLEPLASALKITLPVPATAAPATAPAA